MSCLAAIATAPGLTEIREVPLPDPEAASGLLRVEITGVCGSDWGYYHQLPQTRGPLILGHETVGVIERAGSEAERRWGLKEGDRVALEEYLPCGHCEHCRSGDFRLCEASDWRTGGLRYGTTAISIAPGLWGVGEMTGTPFERAAIEAEKIAASIVDERAEQAHAAGE